MARILVVDDSPTTCLTLATILQREGHEVMWTASTGHALELLSEASYDVVITDRAMPKVASLILPLGEAFAGDAFQDFVADAVEELKEKQAVLHREHGLHDYTQYAWDQPTQTLVLSNGGPRRMVARFLAVGSYSTVDGKWLWSWANTTIEGGAKADIAHVRAFGAARGWHSLTTPSWHGQIVDGWEMTAVAAKILGSVGAYCCESERGSLFLVLREVCLAN